MPTETRTCPHCAAVITVQLTETDLGGDKAEYKVGIDHPQPTSEGCREALDGLAEQIGTDAVIEGGLRIIDRELGL